jgi:hypothetical protein
MSQKMQQRHFYPRCAVNSRKEGRARLVRLHMCTVKASLQVQSSQLLPILVIQAINQGGPDCLSIIRYLTQKTPMRSLFPTVLLPVVHGAVWEEVKNF